MSARGIRLPFKLLGVPLLLDWSFLLILPLITWTIGSRLPVLAELFGLPSAATLAQGPVAYLIGFIAAIGLFACVVLHELGHAMTARLYGVEVRSITLWFLGGLAQFEQLPRQRGAEAVVAIIGPLVSILLAGVLWMAEQNVIQGSAAVRFVLRYLFYVNAMVGLFNLLPAMPLDGGRILRSLLALRLPHLRATELAGRVSRATAVAIGVTGILSFNFFLLLIAVFIYHAVTAELRMTQVEELLRGVPVRFVMNRDVRTVPPEILLSELAEHVLRERHVGFPVVDGDRHVLGMITLADLPGHEPRTPVGSVMSRELPTVSEDSDTGEVFEIMNRDGVGRVPVVDAGGRLVGLVTQTDVMRMIRLRSTCPEVAATDQQSASAPMLQVAHSTRQR